MENKELIFLPLGGTGEIGMNVNLYQYMGKWLMIDCGAGFADQDIPGVDIIVADISFIEERKEDLVGIIITHAHEDHCGGLPHLWHKLGVPLYTTQFTANFLRRKIGSKKIQLPINVVVPGKQLKLGPFKLDFINMTHFVPEMSAIAIHTEEGVVVHSGDWKLDDEPVFGKKSNLKKLQEVAQNGVLSLICDSTNIFSSGRSESESVLYPSLKNIIKEVKGACVVTLFSSNIFRIETIGRIARELGKKVAVLGRSLLDVIASAKESGYLKDLDFMIGEDLLYAKNRNELLILSTGCQGDLLASVNKLSCDVHPYFKMHTGDTIVFSSKMIPGNEKRISNIINRFAIQDVNVVTEKTHKVHVSGHPYKEELRQMYDLLKPNSVIPVHGENIHLKEHAAFIKRCGIKHTIVPADGDIIKITKDAGITKVGCIETFFWGVDNGELQHPDGEVIQKRKKLQNAGLIVVVIVVNKKLRPLKKPAILTFGYTESPNWKQKVIRTLETELHPNNTSDFKSISKFSRRVVRSALVYKSKMPMIEIQIERL